MDEFVTKPIRYAELLAAMQKVVPDMILAPENLEGIPQKISEEELSFGTDPQQQRSCSLTTPPCWKSVGGSRALLREVVRTFFSSRTARASLADLRAAAEKRDPSALEACGHALKGLMSELHADRAAVLARQLEDSGHSCDLHELDSCVAALLSESEILKRQLQQFADTLKDS